MCPIPKELQDFIVEDGRCDCWGDADYEPPGELDDLMSECERDQVQDEESGTKPENSRCEIANHDLAELEEFEIPTPRKTKSFQQRLAERRTRKKRLAMAKEAHSWYMNQNIKTPVPAAAKKRMAPPTRICPPKPRHSASSRHMTDSDQVPHYKDSYNHGVDRKGAPPSSNKFKTSTRSKDTDTMLTRSFASPVTCQRMLDALEWDSD